MPKSLSELAPKFFVLGYGYRKGKGGIGKEIFEFLKLGISGIVIFERNLIEPIQLWTNLNSFVSFSNRKLVIATDQEGGGYSSLKRGFTIGVPPMAFEKMKDRKRYLRLQAETISKELRETGINTIFAPSLDVNTEPNNPIIGMRAFSSNPYEVYDLASTYIDSLKKNRIIVCVKHFPGHGGTSEDSHKKLPIVDISYADFQNIHLLPFEKIIKERDIDMVMTAHVVFPSVDKMPATLSKKILNDILRKELKFEGIVISDCLEMNAMKKEFGIEKAVVQAFESGVDLILMSHNPSVHSKAIKALSDAFESGSISKKRIKDSLNRIEKLLSKIEDFPSIPPTFKVNHNFQREISKKAINVEGNIENISLKRVLIVNIKKTKIYAKILRNELLRKAEEIVIKNIDEINEGLFENFDQIFFISYFNTPSAFLSRYSKEYVLMRKYASKVFHINLYSPYVNNITKNFALNLTTYGSSLTQFKTAIDFLKEYLLR